MGQKYARGDANGNIIAYYDDTINPAAQIGTAIKITDAQWSDSVANPGKYVVGAGALMLAPPPTEAQVAARHWAAYQYQARLALESSDIAMHRIAEAVAVGATTWAAADVVAFASWRRSLRAILTQSQPAVLPASLPARPTYPAGT